MVLSTGVTFWIRERIILGYQPKMLLSTNHRARLHEQPKVLPSGSEIAEIEGYG